MLTKTKKSLQHYFEEIQQGVWSTTELSTILSDHLTSWEAWDVSGRKAARFLIEAKILEQVEFTSTKYRQITRYARGPVSPYRMALSLKPSAYLCHQTALIIHELQSPGQVIYVNQEQTPKPDLGEITQRGINTAFKGKQRRTNFVFRHADNQFVLLNGKSTDRVGVCRIKFGDDEVEVTDLERTLIDIVVRPAYAGGIEEVARAYRDAAPRVNVQYLLKLLQKINHAYPYHQAIGFLLERAGKSKAECSQLRQLGTAFDFYLDYGLKKPLYDAGWRIYFPQPASI
jgi:hypothetical protein